jgi:MFS transporter, ACS family, DAL5 transporter family protein
MAGTAATPGGPFEKQPIQQEKLGVESRDEKRLDSDSSSPAASVDDEAVPVGNGTQLGSTRDHVFSEPASADYWRKVYEQAGYENRHRFDPSFEWTAEEEKKLIRKVRAPPSLATMQCSG